MRLGGGFVAIGVVARVATRTLDPGQRVAFFRRLGRSYVTVGTSALAIAIGTGAGLASDHPWDATMTATAVVTAALVLSLVVGVVQARRMTRLRAVALRDRQDAPSAERVRSGARAATVLRAAIGLLTLALIALGSLLAT